MEAKHYLRMLIRRTRGERQLTLTGIVMDAQVWDISSNGEVGYHPDHRHQFCRMLNKLLRVQEDGGMILREFTELKVERRMADGKLIWIPVKNIYGFIITQGNVWGIPAGLNRACYRIDHTTGEKLTEEPDEVYKDPLF